MKAEEEIKMLQLAVKDIYERLIALEHHAHDAPELSNQTSQPIFSKDKKFKK